MSSSGPTARTASARLEWADAVRGLSIVLVVLLHTSAALDTAGFDTGETLSFNVALATVRMPAFFLVSGLLAGGVMRSRWPEFLHRRPLLFGYLYVLWALLFVLVFAAIAAVGTASVSGNVRTGLHELAYMDGELWYLAALAVFFLLDRATMRVPSVVKVGLALTGFCLVVLGYVDTGSWGWNHMIELYVFFLIGRLARPRIQALATRVRLRGTLGLAIAWLAAVVLLPRIDDRLMFLSAPWAGVPMVVGLCVLTTRTPVVGSALRRLGADTLPIYVLHPLALAGFGAAVSVAGLSDRSVPGMVAVVVTLAVTAAATALSVAAGRLLQPRLPWLFDLPGRFAVRRRVTAVEPRGTVRPTVGAASRAGS